MIIKSIDLALEITEIGFIYRHFSKFVFKRASFANFAT